jgi:hypothetical protein
MDYTYSPEHNFTYVVQWDSQRSIEPANVDDEELVGFGPIVSHPLTRHTVSEVCVGLRVVLKYVTCFTGHDIFPQSPEFHLPHTRFRR